jgi:hypothetical protein
MRRKNEEAAPAQYTTNRDFLTTQNSYRMKHLFLGIALLLAAAAAAQPQTTKLPVMRMADPDLYLTLKPHADPTPATQPAQAGSAGTAVERNLAAEYLLHLAAWEACCPEKYMEEIGALYKAETPLMAERLAYLVKVQRISQYLVEK